MKFKIAKSTDVYYTNIFGKPIEEKAKYYIYRSFLFGLWKKYLWFETKDFRINRHISVCVPAEGDKYYVFYFDNKRNATAFFTEEDAKKMLNNIYNCPDDFIRILDKPCSALHQCSTILEHIK